MVIDLHENCSAAADRFDVLQPDFGETLPDPADNAVEHLDIATELEAA
jgi:hypothetical protein